jgi:hypothetical protein
MSLGYAVCMQSNRELLASRGMQWRWGVRVFNILWTSVVCRPCHPGAVQLDLHCVVRHTNTDITACMLQMSSTA